MNTHVTAFVALGSNLEQPLRQVNQAVAALDALPFCHLLAVSNWYESQAVGPGDQAPYINGVAKLSTELTPLQLLDELQAIEQAQGRQRLIHWGPRTLDLDLLLYGDLILSSPRLTLPHPFMTQRNFVTVPLCDLAPQLILPSGEELADICHLLGTAGLNRLPAANPSRPIN